MRKVTSVQIRHHEIELAQQIKKDLLKHYVDCADMADFIQDDLASFDIYSHDKSMDKLANKTYVQLGQNVINKYNDTVDKVKSKWKSFPNAKSKEELVRYHHTFPHAKNYKGSEKDLYKWHLQDVRHIANTNGYVESKKILNHLIDIIDKRNDVKQINPIVSAEVAFKLKKLASKKHQTVSQVINHVLKNPLKNA